MLSRTVPPLEACLRPANFWRGWIGLVMIAAGMGAAGLAQMAASHLAFLPPKGPVGIRVVLEGKGLAQTRSVRFGPCAKVKAAEFRAVSDERVEVHVPEGALSGPITLTTADGTEFTSGADFQVTQERPGPPAITGFRPGSGPGGTEVSVEGSGFKAVENAWVGGRRAEYTLHTDASLTLYIPPEHPLSGPIVLASPFGTGSTATAFEVIAAPTVAGP
jgi:hypothetical protein